MVDDRPPPYLVSVVCRAGALLSDTHTETRQAAIFVFLAEIEGSRLAAGARWALNIHLFQLKVVSTYQDTHKAEMVWTRALSMFSPCRSIHHWSSLHSPFGHRYSSYLEQGSRDAYSLQLIYTEMLWVKLIGIKFMGSLKLVLEWRSVIFLNQTVGFTIDFIANSTFLSNAWIASVSWGTSKIKIDSVLK